MKNLLPAILIGAFIFVFGPAVKAQHHGGHSDYSTHHYAPHGYYRGYGSGGHGYGGQGYGGHSGGHYGHRRTYRPLFGVFGH